METFSALLAICAGNSPAPGEFPTQRPVTRSFDVFFDLCLNKRENKQAWGWWFETPWRPLWRHRIALFSFNLNGMLPEIFSLMHLMHQRRGWIFFCQQIIGKQKLPASRITLLCQTPDMLNFGMMVWMNDLILNEIDLIGSMLYILLRLCISWKMCIHTLIIIIYAITMTS